MKINTMEISKERFYEKFKASVLSPYSYNEEVYKLKYYEEYILYGVISLRDCHNVFVLVVYDIKLDYFHTAQFNSDWCRENQSQTEWIASVVIEIMRDSVIASKRNITNNVKSSYKEFLSSFNTK